MAAAALASRTRLGPDLELPQGQPAPPRARPVSAGPEPGSRLALPWVLGPETGGAAAGKWGYNPA